MKFWVRLLFAGLWNIADKEGRLEDRPKRIKVEIFPYDNADIELGLQILSQKPFIIRYEVQSNRYIQIINWHKHQKPHHTEKESEIPPIPPNYNGKRKGKGNGDGKATQSKCVAKQQSYIRDLTVKKIKYADFVFMTKEEYDKLVKEFGEVETKKRIEELSLYALKIGERKFKSRYSNHYAVILSWDRKEKKDGTHKLSNRPDYDKTKYDKFV